MPRVALVGEGRVGDPVAQHPFAPRECGADPLGDNLRARCEEEQHLATRNRRIRPLLPDERADLLGKRRPAGLARHEDRASFRPQGLRERLHLG